MSGLVRGIFSFGAYLFLLLFPLIIGALSRRPGQGRAFWVELAVACGYVGLAMMAAQFALVSRVQFVSGVFGQDALQHFHKQMGYAVTGFVLAHPMLLILQGLPWGMLNPFTLEHHWVWRFGAIGFWGLALLVCLAAFRKRLKLSYEWWHVTHAIIAAAAVSSALVHVYLVGYDSSRTPMRVLWSLYLLTLFGLVLRYRILRPLKMWRKPWEVVENIREHGNARTLVLHPIDHDGLRFAPGQFAWLNTGKTPFHFDQHPISISSSAENGANCQIAFTIKPLGDWSGEVVPAIKPGARVWLDGPYGVLSPDRDQGPGYVMIAGGVGITPLHSMCETLAIRDDCRPVILFYAAHDYDELIFREDLEKLQKQMNLKLVYVPEKPSLGWDGEQGRITAELLRRRLPRHYKRFQFFICGPTLLMDAVEQELHKLEVGSDFIHSERFDLV